MGHAVFLTGATGFIGGELLQRLLARPEVERVYALVRARDGDDLARRGREVLWKLHRDDDAARRRVAARVAWVRGDLGAEGLGLAAADRDAIVERCQVLIHGAASTDFDLPEPEARKVNFDGARRVLDLAEAVHARGRLRRLVHISTAYVAGRRSGICRESELPPPEGPFNNTYELTKASAERLLRTRMGTVPITVVRPSIVVGSSETGRTYNFNVLYYPIKLMHRGLLPYVPGLPQTTLDVVPVDWVCEATLALADHPEAEGGTFHLTAGDDAMPLARFGARICEYFARQRRAAGQEPQRATRVVRPWLFRLITWWLKRRLAGRAREQLDAFMVYLPYLLTEKRFLRDGADRLVGQAAPYPPIDGYIEKVAEYAVTREWGRRVSWDPALLESGLWSGSGSSLDHGSPGASAPLAGAAPGAPAGGAGPAPSPAAPDEEEARR